MNSNVMEREHLLMLLMSASIIIFNLIGFIVCYFVWFELRKDSSYLYENGKELLNFHISYVIYTFIASVSVVILVGIFLLPVVSIAYVVLTIIGMFKYGFHQDYRYPFTINFIK